MKYSWKYYVIIIPMYFILTGELILEHMGNKIIEWRYK